ncbi:hypothetical protein [Paenibacillus harenae]|uniref:hypothetical protein n=1 Tax=Paenibacillus harenae TaxID=306543 RepID=UPI0027929F41|nr:hypothetical protein [Paenibacillus harenae]MDQ0062276.1 hypothetical protein [Paenibacillus harenae]
MVKHKWTLLSMGFVLVLAAIFLLQGTKDAGATGDLSDPLLDPYALSLAHRHAGAGAESAAEKGIAIRLKWPEGDPQAGVPAMLALTITGSGDKPIEAFDITNEKLLHLIIVSEDLQYFQHVHPEHKGGGVFELPIAFPASGKFKLYVDFVPTGMNELTRTGTVQVGGVELGRAAFEPSDKLTASVDGMKVTLAFSDELAPQTQMSMTYTFTDEKTGEPITDLELYLGAVGHVVAIDQTTEQFIHIHPLNWASSGPQAVFGAAFPGGLYKVWGQFQRNGKTFVVPFVIKV